MKKLNKGFTLVELIIVIAILAIIMLIAIPNFSGIQQRMKVRADKSTAAQIGKAVRVWYTDYMTDPTLKGTLEIAENAPVGTPAANDTKKDNLFVVGKNFVHYDELTGIESYCSEDYDPTSLLTAANGTAEEFQFYLVGLSDATSAAKVLVAITDGDDATTYTAFNLPADVKVTYNGTAPAIAYVEP